MSEYPQDIIEAAEDCYLECEQLDSYGIISSIAKAISAERGSSFYAEDLANEVFSAINWKEVPLADYNAAVELIRKTIFAEMKRAFCEGWERGNSIYGCDDAKDEFQEWMKEIDKTQALLPMRCRKSTR